MEKQWDKNCILIFFGKGVFVEWRRLSVSWQWCTFVYYWSICMLFYRVRVRRWILAPKCLQSKIQRRETIEGGKEVGTMGNGEESASPIAFGCQFQISYINSKPVISHWPGILRVKSWIIQIWVGMWLIFLTGLTRISDSSSCMFCLLVFYELSHSAGFKFMKVCQWAMTVFPVPVPDLDRLTVVLQIEVSNLFLSAGHTDWKFITCPCYIACVLMHAITRICAYFSGTWQMPTIAGGNS